MPRKDKRAGLLGKAMNALEETTGQVVMSSKQADLYESVYEDYRVLNRQLEDIGWSVLDYVGGAPQEVSSPARRRTVQRARYVWMNDPQAGASVELMNDFCFGRGVPKPRCKDPKVQEVVDEAWNDPDNQEVLTSYEAQLAIGTDLSLQSNLFILMFDDGDDGKVKLSILRHDDVTNAIPDPDMRHRVLYYVCGQPRKQVWNFKLGNFQPVQDVSGSLKPMYYAHWRNVELAMEESNRDTPLDTPPDDQMGDGKVYHARLNRYSEQIFGVPRFQRTLRWYSAYNEFVKTRIDRAAAAAAIIMKRKIKGSPSQLARDASKMISRVGALGTSAELGGLGASQQGPRPASIIEENESVSHEALNLDSGSANAAEDAQMIRAPISAAERWTQAYFGDASNSSLATATSLELPILKAVEGRQEVFEGIFRWFIDRVIERAVESGRLPKNLTPEEIQAEREKIAKDKPPDMSSPLPGADMASMNGNGGMPADQQQLQQTVLEAIRIEEAAGRDVLEAHLLSTNKANKVVLLASKDAAGCTIFTLFEAPEVPGNDPAGTPAPADEIEVDPERDLGYEFSLPSPLRRMMGELVTAVTQLATTFDPNNTNTELSRALLTIALGQGLEVEDPAAVVETIYPPGYQDPAIQMAQQQAQQQAQAMQPQSSDAFPTGPDGNAYSAPMNASQPGDAYPWMQQQAASVVWSKDTRAFLDEGFKDLPEPTRRQAEGRRDEAAELFRKEVVQDALTRLDQVQLLPGEPNGDKSE